jgi:hypothetical protein
MKQRQRKIDDLIYAEIEERRLQPDANRTDILSLMMAARDENGQPMTNEELRDELMTLLFAGHETTATALGAPEVAARIRQFGGKSRPDGDFPLTLPECSLSGDAATLPGGNADVCARSAHARGTLGTSTRTGYGCFRLDLFDPQTGGFVSRTPAI